MAAKKKVLEPHNNPNPTALKRDPVYRWALQSSKPTNGGAVLTYEVRLNDDSSLSCDCPSWRFSKKGVRGCKHTRNTIVQAEAPDVVKKWQAGEILPILQANPGFHMPSQLSPAIGDGSKVKYGRVLQLED